jgi:hypothetical protein
VPPQLYAALASQLSRNARISHVLCGKFVQHLGVLIPPSQRLTAVAVQRQSEEIIERRSKSAVAVKRDHNLV